MTDVMWLLKLPCRRRGTARSRACRAKRPRRHTSRSARPSTPRRGHRARSPRLGLNVQQVGFQNFVVCNIYEFFTTSRSKRANMCNHIDKLSKPLQPPVCMIFEISYIQAAKGALITCQYDCTFHEELINHHCPMNFLIKKLLPYITLDIRPINFH